MMEEIPSRDMQQALLIADLLSRAQVLIEAASSGTLTLLNTGVIASPRYGDLHDVRTAKEFITNVLLGIEP